MRTIIFSDLHGNLVALEKLLNLHSDVENWISLGDNVNYGPWSNECVDILESDINCQSILGNHEDAFIAGEYHGTHPTVVQFFDKCIASFKRRDVIKRYPSELYFEGYTLVHTLENKYIYSDTEVNIDKNYIVGHSHEQYLIERNGFDLINPGICKELNHCNAYIYEVKTKKTNQSILIPLL